MKGRERNLKVNLYSVLVLGGNASFNSMDSQWEGIFQLFVGVSDICLVWYLLVLPSETHADANMTSLKAVNGDTSYH